MRYRLSTLLIKAAPLLLFLMVFGPLLFVGVLLAVLYMESWIFNFQRR